jgi:hypothetical protein
MQFMKMIIRFDKIIRGIPQESIVVFSLCIEIRQINIKNVHYLFWKWLYSRYEVFYDTFKSFTTDYLFYGIKNVEINIIGPHLDE